ncbi:hypothetical protein DV26_21950 [Amycolatopsis mediterranei]|nr:hypothetical protein DV26_21950 [Amycolatopsis mediterranei]
MLRAEADGLGDVGGSVPKTTLAPRTFIPVTPFRRSTVVRAARKLFDGTVSRGPGSPSSRTRCRCPSGGAPVHRDCQRKNPAPCA